MTDLENPTNEPTATNPSNMADPSTPPNPTKPSAARWILAVAGRLGRGHLRDALASGRSGA